MEEVLIKVKELINSVLTKYNGYVDSAKFESRDGETILSVIIDRKESFDFDDVVKISEESSKVLDTLPELNIRYFLDISTLGPEKEIKDLSSLGEYVGEYVEVTQIKGDVFLGTIISVNDEEVEFTERVKTRLVKRKIPLSNIKSIFLRIKF